MSTMNINGLEVKINCPKAIEDKEKEETHGLPPYAEREVYNVEEYEGCPENWIRGNKDSKSFFVGVEEREGMWLDFNNCKNLDKEVAIVVSIQGVNPLTGLKTNGLKLEQYLDKCPKHKTELQNNRLCKECGFVWPKQNYISSAGTPHGLLWLDGFRRGDGKVRQYVFSEEMLRGIATQIIGEERVFAIGIAFHKAKRAKEKSYYTPPIRHEVFPLHYIQNHPNHPLEWTDGEAYKKFGGNQWGDANYENQIKLNDGHSLENKHLISKPLGGAVRCCSAGGQTSQRESLAGKIELNESSKEIEENWGEEKKLEIAAGSQIKQNVYDDPNDVDFYENKPSGIIYINYTDKGTAKRLIKSKIQPKKEGFMESLVVGSR